MHLEDALAAELAAAALVGLGGVGVAVTEDDFAGGECGEDDLGDRLSAISEHECHLGGGGDRAVGGLRTGVEKNAADSVAEDCPAGLAEGDDVMAFALKCGGEAADLGGLSGTVEALEGDEVSARHSLQLIAVGRDGI